MKYRIEVTYAAGNKQTHDALGEEQARLGADAFLRDLFGLAGTGVKALRVEAVRDAQREVCDVCTDLTKRAALADDLADREREREALLTHMREVHGV